MPPSFVRAEGLDATFRPADAEDLPFEDGHFDCALSIFGVMFAPRQQRVADELIRVVRPGGRIGLACWTPEGFLGDLFRVIAAHVPAPAGLDSPMRWGDERHLVERFGPQAADISCTRRLFNFRYKSAAHWVEVFRAFYGPIHKAFGALDDAGQDRLHAHLVALLDGHNRGGGDSLLVPGE